MNTELFIAKRIISDKNAAKKISRPIIRIAIIGIALGLAVMIITVAIVTGFQSEIRDKIIGFGSHIQITNYDANNSYEPNPISAKQDFYPLLLKIPEVKHVQVYATKNGIIKTKTDNEGVLLKGIGKDYDWTFIKKNLVEGNVFAVNDTEASKQIVVSKQTADRLGIKINDRLIIYFITKKKSDPNKDAYSEYEQRVKDFHVSGIYETGFEEFDKKMVFVDIAQVQKLNYWTKDQIGGFEVLVDNYDDIDKTGDVISDIIGPGFNAQTIKRLQQTIFSWLDLQDVNATIVITLMILVAAINMISALLILILERTNMIGTLKSLGASNGSIQKIFLYNGAYLIGKGLLWGNVIGIALCFIQIQSGIFTLPKETYYVSVIPIHISFTYFLLLNIGTMMACMLMLILPSFLISKITPAKAIHFR